MADENIVAADMGALGSCCRQQELLFAFCSVALELESPARVRMKLSHLRDWESLSESTFLKSDCVLHTLHSQTGPQINVGDV